MCSRDLARTSRVTTHRPRFGRGRPPNIAGRGLDPKRLRPCAGLLSGVTAGASVGWLSSDVASGSDADDAASSCLEAVSVEAADVSSLSLFSGVVAGAVSSFSSGFSSSSTFFAPGRCRLKGTRGLGPLLVRLKRAPEFGRPPGLFGAAVVEEAAAVLEVLVLPEDFPPKRLPPPKRFLAPFAGVAAVVVVGASASA